MTLPTALSFRRTLRHTPLGLMACASVGVALLTSGIGAQGAAPTFAKDVAPILYRNCTSCHRPGGLGPMSLISYEDARSVASDMRDAVGSGFMPPWHADSPHGTFVNDRRLSDADIKAILAWVDGGTPSGDAKDLPAVPSYSGSWSTGTPDLVVGMSAAYMVPAKGTVEYQYFEVPTKLTEDKWVQSIEIMPGARPVVHHVLVFARAPSVTPPAPAAAGAPRPTPLLLRRDDQSVPENSPGPDGKQRELGALVATTAPGTNVLTLPPGTALRLRAGTVLTFQMHYTAHGEAMADSTRVGIVFAKEAPAEEIRASSFQNGQFVIPAGADGHRVPAEIGFREAVHVWGLFPHTHVRGKKWEYRLVHPDGRSEMILSVPNYDFNWQTYYMFAKPLAIPAGARIESFAWYDNSAKNPANPDASKEVRWGDQTWEEMQYTGLLYSVDSRRLTVRPPRQ